MRSAMVPQRVAVVVDSCGSGEPSCRPLSAPRLLDTRLRFKKSSSAGAISLPSPTSATRGQNAHNSLISGSRKPKVGTTRPRAEGEDKGDSDADSRRGLGR